MMKQASLMVMVLLAVTWSSTAAAEVRAGVPVEVLTPPGTQLVDVQLSAVADQPVRLAYAPRDGEGSRVYLDVYVAPDEAGAHAALERERESVAGIFEARSGLGDYAYGGGDLIAFCRDNVFMVIRSARGHDMLSWAHALDEVIQRSAVGSPRASATLTRMPDVSPGQASVHHEFPNQVLGSMVLAHGASMARRTERGWRLSAPVGEAAAFEVRLVDRRLRQP